MQAANDAYFGRTAVDLGGNRGWAIHPSIARRVVDRETADRVRKSSGASESPVATHAEGWLDLCGDIFAIESTAHPPRPSVLYEPELEALTVRVPLDDGKRTFAMHIHAKYCVRVPLQRCGDALAFAASRTVEALRAAGLVRASDGVIQWDRARAWARDAIRSVHSVVPPSRALRDRLTSPGLDTDDRLRVVGNVWLTDAPDRFATPQVPAALRLSSDVSILAQASACRCSVDKVPGAALESNGTVGTSAHFIRGAAISNDEDGALIGVTDVENGIRWWGDVNEAESVTRVQHRVIRRIRSDGAGVEFTEGRAAPEEPSETLDGTPLTRDAGVRCSVTLRAPTGTRILSLWTSYLASDMPGELFEEVSDGVFNLRKPTSLLTISVRVGRDEAKRLLTEGSSTILCVLDDGTVRWVRQTRHVGVIHAIVPRKVVPSSDPPKALPKGTFGLLPLGAPPFLGRVADGMSVDAFVSRMGGPRRFLVPRQFRACPGLTTSFEANGWVASELELGYVLDAVHEDEQSPWSVLTARNNGRRFAFGTEGFVVSDRSQVYLSPPSVDEILERSGTVATGWLWLDRPLDEAWLPFDQRDTPILFSGTLVNILARKRRVYVQWVGRLEGISPPTVRQLVTAGARDMKSGQVIAEETTHEDGVMVVLKHDAKQFTSSRFSSPSQYRLTFRFDPRDDAKSSVFAISGARGRLTWEGDGLSVTLPRGVLAASTGVLLFGSTRALPIVEVVSEQLDVTLSPVVQYPVPDLWGEGDRSRRGLALSLAGAAESIVTMDVDGETIHLDGTPASLLRMEPSRPWILRCGPGLSALSGSCIKALSEGRWIVSSPGTIGVHDTLGHVVNLVVVRH